MKRLAAALVVVADGYAAERLAAEARNVLDETAGAIIDGRVAHVGAIGRAGYLRWRDRWVSYDRALARIPGPLAEC